MSMFDCVPCQGLRRRAARTKTETRDGLLFCLGNPLLDIQAKVPKSFLEKWTLKQDDAILCDEARVPMFHEMIENYEVDYVAGGATQNVARVCQWLLGKPNVVTFAGCIGKDKFGEILEEKARSVGVNTIYQKHDTEKTGTCACCLYDHYRSLCAHLAAANHFTKDHLEIPQNWALVEAAKFYYVAGFHLTVCPPAIQLLAEHACTENKVFTMNLSAPFLISVFRKPMMEAMPYVDVLFGNETEAMAFATEHNWEANEVPDIALKLSELPKKNANSRMVVITQGSEPVVVVQGGKTQRFSVKPMQKAEIVDTNGAGDAFAGGFMAQYIQGCPLAECVKCGMFAAREIIMRSGCSLPEKCEYK